ncbi:MAG: RsbRD N-terminal domain-containing protein [Deltaproteobacteria bacterium]|nr:RsbRD N-terminal domain-containing protein [Deltaproteobacteria bacterium]MBW1962713.1 RsbRD N-terminal domain-containing protein [Deltaproteobacteria bacterium]MBW1996221.1 RsbRD N-terminal domain-containing protein [Deltaproteobacteria bacterium]MBW2151862.1 RsbRD N-terminal domain-containing protein [Deltaproteobacteria bacterium]
MNKEKDKILNQWFDLVMRSYPKDTAKFYMREEDTFANPVGSTIFQGLNALLDELFGAMDHETLKSSLDPIIRIRAVQGFSPSDAVAFIFSLKTIIRKNLAKEINNNPEVATSLLAFETNIDRLGLIGFDIYNACKEKIHELKVKEIRKTAFRRVNNTSLPAKSRVVPSR